MPFQPYTLGKLLLIGNGVKSDITQKCAYKSKTFDKFYMNMTNCHILLCPNTLSFHPKCIHQNR